MSARDPSFYIQQAEKIPSHPKVTSTRIQMICPFHPDTNPSGSISIDPIKPNFLGKFRCWSCGKTADWNEIADLYGLQKLNGSSSAAPKKAVERDFSRVRQRLFGSKEQETKPIENSDYGEYQDTNDGMTLFPLQEDWRGFSKEFLEGLGARLAFVEQTGYFYLRFPVVVHGKEVGYFRAQMRKPPKGIPTYLNKPGEWVKTKGAFPLDKAIEIAKENDLRSIVVVEGPRDALRLIRDGIPAVAIMGTHNWTPQKRRLLEMEFDRIVLCLDGDKAGKKAAIKIYKDVKTRMDVKVLRLWRIAEARGLKKMDPFDMPDDVLERLRRLVI